MKSKEFNILLDIKKQNKSEQIEIVRGDINTNVFNITITDGANQYDLYGLDVNIIFKKADGTTVQQIDIEKVNDVQGKIKCTLKTNTIACVGKVIAEVKIISEGKLLTSTNFSFYVRDSLLNDETIESTDEFPILTQLIDQTNQLIEEVRQIEEQVPQSVVDRINALETTTEALTAEVEDKIDKSSIANNLVTTESGMVLDARQGKALKVLIDEQNNKLENKLINSSSSDFIKFDDGTAICYITATATYQSARRAYAWVRFPIPFISVPMVTATIGTVTSSNWLGDKDNLGSVSLGTVNSADVDIWVIAKSTDIASGNNVKLNIIVIGRWK